MMKRYGLDAFDAICELKDGPLVYWEDAQAEIERLQNMIYEARYAVLNEEYDADVLRILGWKEDDEP